MSRWHARNCCFPLTLVRYYFNAKEIASIAQVKVVQAIPCSSFSPRGTNRTIAVAYKEESIRARVAAKAVWECYWIRVRDKLLEKSCRIMYACMSRINMCVAYIMFSVAESWMWKNSNVFICVTTMMCDLMIRTELCRFFVFIELSRNTQNKKWKKNLWFRRFIEQHFLPYVSILFLWVDCEWCTIFLSIWKRAKIKTCRVRRRWRQ